ncbi:MAG: SusC/RagA family TonB-linked outer membrane protein, partial [Bacteroidales bacterium]
MEFNTKVFQIKTLTRSLITIVCICFFSAPAFAQYDLSGAVSVRNQKQTVSTMLYGGTNNASMQTAPSKIEPRTLEAIPQNKSIKGTVVNAADGTPVPGAVVQVVGTNKYATTDADGKFTINAGGKAISVQCLGFKTITVGNLTDGMTIKMTAELVKLDDVVVVGYGSQKKVTLTGSVTSTKGETVEKNSSVNLSQGLAGRLPGVIINNRSGEPGADGTTIFIRGRSTLGDNSPLIIIDGIAGRENLDRINPEDIASITVLKDASAAIYGSRSANGVILVTTKRGNLDQKPVITFSYDLGIQHATRLLKLCDANQYAAAYNQANELDGVSDAYTSDEIKAIKEGTNRVEYPNTDWFHEIIKPASFQHKFGITISGGSKNMNYFVSANGQMQDGIYRKSATKYDLAGFRANIDTKVAKNLKIGVDISGRQQHKDYSAFSSDNYGIFYMAARRSPLSTAYYPNGL